MRITSSVTSSTLFLALIIASRADSDESDESGERNTKFFTRITSLLYRTTKNQGLAQEGPGSIIQPYPYIFMGIPYYIGTNAGPYWPADYQSTPPQRYPSVAYSAPQPAPGANPFELPSSQIPKNANPNFSLYPNYPAYPRIPAYNPYPSIPTQAYSSDKKHRHRHSSEEDSEEREYSRGHHDSGNGVSSMDHSLKSNTEYQETGHYFGRPLGLRQ